MMHIPWKICELLFVPVGNKNDNYFYAILFYFEAGYLFGIDGNTVIKILEGRSGEREKYGMCLRWHCKECWSKQIQMYWYVG